MAQQYVDLDERPAVPKQFDQLGILVLDGSGSMNDVTSDGKMSKAQAVNIAVRELLTKLKSSRVKSNFSIAVVTFDTTATPHTAVTAVSEIDDYADYDPMARHGGGTDIGQGLRCAEGIARDFLAKWTKGSPSRSVVIVVMSDGMSAGEPLAIANQLKTEANITICTTLFAAAGEDRKEAADLLRDIASTPLLYRTTYDAEGLRDFFIRSVSSGKNVSIT